MEPKFSGGLVHALPDDLARAIAEKKLMNT